MARRPPVPVAFRVQKYLRGLRYPAHKTELLDHARKHGIEQDAALLQALLALPEREYPTPVALARELGTAALARKLRPRGPDPQDA